jgi:Leucine-rich repeat (LRR) protein
MKELTDTEIQWLEAFAKKHEFFASFLLHYRLKQHLSNNQYYWLHLYINQANEQGDTLLTPEELRFLEENSGINDKLRDILKIYKDKGYLENAIYKELLDIKAGMTGVEMAETVEPTESPFRDKVSKVPCPHCSFLCSPQIHFCLKCGEPLPKLEKFSDYPETSDIFDVDFTEQNIIHSLEKQINKPIPLSESLNLSSTCYVKEGEEITGLSLFKTGLYKFPREVLRIKSLKDLALRRNEITNLPKEIGFLSNLESLDLRINQLETLPHAIGLLINLKNLNISSNNLKEIPESIGELLMLKNLNLSNNKLKEIPECIENLSCLESLNLKANYWIQMPECIEKLKEQGLQIII